jgi:hypothetical protein
MVQFSATDRDRLPLFPPVSSINPSSFQPNHYKRAIPGGSIVLKREVAVVENEQSIAIFLNHNNAIMYLSFSVKCRAVQQRFAALYYAFEYELQLVFQGLSAHVLLFTGEQGESMQFQITHWGALVHCTQRRGS